MLLHCSLGLCFSPVAWAEVFPSPLGDSRGRKEYRTLSQDSGMKTLKTKFACPTRSYTAADTAKRCPLEHWRIGTPLGSAVRCDGCPGDAGVEKEMKDYS